MRYKENRRPAFISRIVGRTPMIRTLATLLFAALLLSGTLAMARERPLDLIYAGADADGNGLISEAEWHAAMQKRFEAMDLNGDGNISKEEMEKAKESARDKFRNSGFRN